MNAPLNIFILSQFYDEKFFSMFFIKDSLDNTQTCN